MTILDDARQFIYREARLIDRLAFAAEFDGGDPAAVVTALAAYQNSDGGFGHGLEPDTRAPTSQPLYVELALQYMADAGIIGHPIAYRACDFLAEHSSPNAGVPILLASYKLFPHAAHWQHVDMRPGINPNGGITGLLFKLRIAHPWRQDAEKFCWDALDGLQDAHEVSEALIFLEHVPDRTRAEPIARHLINALPTTALFKTNPEEPGYGLDIHHLVPAPQSFTRHLIADRAIEQALDHLVKQQQPDGGWPINWQPPGDAARSEWRGICTLKALRSLKSYGRLPLAQSIPR